MTARPLCSTLALGVALTLASPAAAQTGSIVGTVQDETQAVVRGAVVVLAGASTRQTTTTGPGGDYRFDKLRAGTYRLSVLFVGFSEAVRDNLVVGEGEVTVPPILLSIAGMAEAVVVTASRSESALMDAPATMTVVPGTALEVGPAQNYGDVLRSVPGMNVIQMSARDVNLTSRQATTTLATSQLALVDGRSVYLDFFGMILWDFVPTNPDDIEQIEVVRGPASAVWGANALTGVVNIVTKSPRKNAGKTSLTLSAGLFDRDAGSTRGKGAGALFGVNATTSQTVGERWAFRVSAGYFDSDRFARPTGRIPVITDPRDPTGTATVGGAFYPADAEGPLGLAFPNRGTRQPRFEARVDQDLERGRITYTGGVAGTQGMIYTGIGPFDIQPGSWMSYGRVNYTRNALSVSAFTNIVNADAPSELVPDAQTGRPLQLNFKTASYDIEVRDATAIGRRNALTYGGNYRRNNFDITLAPAAKDRNEIGAYVQDEIFMDRFRFSVGARIDKFGNLQDPAFSPRLSAIYKLTPDHSLRFGFNRAFRSPSSINNYIDTSLVTLVDLSPLAPLLPPELAPAVAPPFPLVVRLVGSDIPVPGLTRSPLTKESLTAYEMSYTGKIHQGTTVGASFYVNDSSHSITFVPLAPNIDPYTPTNPPPGWPLPPSILGVMAQLGVFLPRTAFSYFNLGPTRQDGLELSIDHRLGRTLSTFANYSWQRTPQILDDPNPFPFRLLSLPPRHRFNIGGTYSGPRFIGALSVQHTSKAFWSDVLTPEYYGFTDAFTMVNGSFGVRLKGGRIIPSLKSTNLLNQTIQQHVFGDLIRRSVTAEVRLDF